MIISYTELPEVALGWPRPLLDIALGDMDEARVPCLVDSGSVHTLLPRWLASAAGIDLKGTEQRELAVAARATTARFSTASLRAGDFVWEADIGFCDPWPYSWGLLGQRSFFHFFTVTFRAADFEFEVALRAA